MNVSLTSELEHFVASKVESGRYRSASEVVREALRLLEDREHVRAARLEALRKEIRVGLDQLDRSEGQNYADEGLKDLIEEVKSRGRKRLTAERKTAS